MYNTIVVGTNGTPSARGAVARAARLAKTCGARMVVVAAYKDPTASWGMNTMAMPSATVPVVDIRDQVEAMLAETAKDVRRGGVEVDTVAFMGSAVQAILDVAEREEADLIVVGNKGMQGARRYLGSVPSTVAHQAACSVLIINTSR